MISGIELSYWNLLVLAIINSVLLLSIVIIGFFAFSVLKRESSREEKEHLEKLKQKAETDSKARKRLEKMRRRMAKKKKAEKRERLEKIFICTVLSILFVCLLIYCVIPCWSDYIIKDNMVYEGEFKVVRSSSGKYHHRNNIELQDGTYLTGSGGLPEGNYSGTIVYSKRSLVVLGQG